MLDHVSIGVRDLAKTKAFYDSVLGTLGYRCLRAESELLGYGADSVQLWISPSASPVAPDMQSGLHFCFIAPTRASVDAFHSKGIAAGAQDNGAPGIRPDYSPGYYAAFVIDPDGYRLEAYCHVSD